MVQQRKNHFHALHRRIRQKLKVHTFSMCIISQDVAVAWMVIIRHSDAIAYYYGINQSTLQGRPTKRGHFALWLVTFWKNRKHFIVDIKS